LRRGENDRTAAGAYPRAVSAVGRTELSGLGVKTIGAGIAGAAALFLAARAEAAVIYAFEGPGGLSTYVSQGFVTADTGPLAFSSCLNQGGVVCGTVQFDVAPSGLGARDVAVLSALDNGMGGPGTFVYHFDAGALATEGIHRINSAAAMAVIDVGDDYQPGDVVYLLSLPDGIISYVHDGYVVADTGFVAPDRCGLNDLACVGIYLVPGATYGGPYDTFGFNVQPPGVSHSYGMGSSFAAGAFSSPGIHQAINGGDLAVIPLPAAVPEPATWAILLAGLGLVGLALRQRRPGLASS